jgi:hypothetical protein
MMGQAADLAACPAYRDYQPGQGEDASDQVTAVPKDPAISELRELFRYLQDFRAVYEATGLDRIRTPYGNEWSLWDLEYLYAASQKYLTLRQKQSIALCLVHNMREKDAARVMRVSLTNPVMMYATHGIRRLLDMVDDGELDLFQSGAPSLLSREERRLKSLHLLADKIKADIMIGEHNCWNYTKLVPGKPPVILVRSVHSSSHFLPVHPLRVMYEAHVGPVPPGTKVIHFSGPFDNPCVNPQHGLISKAS